MMRPQKNRPSKKPTQPEEVISPLDFLEFDDEDSTTQTPPQSTTPQPQRSIDNTAVKGSNLSGVRPVQRPKVRKGPPSRVRGHARAHQHHGRRAKQGRAFFISATDTGVGKTVVTAVLGTLLKDKGINIGVMKPVQCGGTDALYLKDFLKTIDPLEEINPYLAPEPLSPHLAFERQKTTIEIGKIKDTFNKLRNRHDILLIEGAGGLLVPLKVGYTVADLIKELDVELIIVSRLGLGTINHTLLTVAQAREMGIRVRGVIFNESATTEQGIPEQTNPSTIGQLTGVPIIGTVPRLDPISRENILKLVRPRLNLKWLLEDKWTDRSAQLRDWDKKYVWHPFTQMKDWLAEEPLIIERGRGSYLIDTQGNKYLDGVSSLWVNLHGHGNPALDRALKEQINKISHSTMLGLANVPAIELAKKLVDIAPHGLEKVFYSDNGSTAVEVAIKMVYQYWQNKGLKNKTKIAHLANAYHGDTLGSVSVGGIDLFHKVYNRLTFDTLFMPFSDGYHVPKGKKFPDYAFECVDKMEGVFKTSHQKIAALVVEPIVQGAAGMLIWPEGVLKRMRELCTKYDIFLIADEVATGFGRTGKMFACGHENITPDLLCLAKGITGGYLPLAATLTTKKVFDGFLFDYKEQKTFFHGHTYTGNPLACAAALANLEIFEQNKVLEKLQPKIAYLSEKLKVFNHLICVGDIRQKGFMVGIELVKNKETKEPFVWEEKIGVRVCQEARSRGVILRPLGNVIVLMPPLSIAKNEMDQLLDVTFWAIQKITGQK